MARPVVHRGAQLTLESTRDWHAHCRECNWIFDTSMSRAAADPPQATRDAAASHAAERSHRVVITWRSWQEAADA